MWRAASTLRPASVFLVGELRGGARRYSVASGAVVILRHRSRDIDLVNEVFGSIRAYEPPETLVGELSGPVRILDLGGNIGMFGAFALGRWDVRGISSFEPDPQNAAILERTIAANRAAPRWTMERAAVSNTPGRMAFLAGHLSQSRRAQAGEHGIDVPAIDVFCLDHRVDLLKMDIEGGEWSILTDPRLPELGARTIVMEWHWRFAPQPDAHGAALALLNRAGYEIHRDRIDQASEAFGLVWAKRP